MAPLSLKRSRLLSHSQAKVKRFDYQDWRAINLTMYTKLLISHSNFSNTWKKINIVSSFLVDLCVVVLLSSKLKRVSKRCGGKYYFDTHSLGSWQSGSNRSHYSTLFNYRDVCSNQPAHDLVLHQTHLIISSRHKLDVDVVLCRSSHYTLSVISREELLVASTIKYSPT